ncbi:MAG: type II toxin-antitoxin system Phd/YefM family antitoxin [Atopobiaceae bacterium]|nr:type II toxin-antitoxin system Phd/YefM family antitoxin [Atopobiaceae bacterium]
MPTIISSTKLRNEYNSVSEECHATGRPVFVTRNGNGDLAVMSMEAYERLVSDGMADLYALLAEGRADADAGRTRPAADVISDLRARLLS